MRIRIPKRKSLKSIWIKQDGDDYEQNVFDALGHTIEESRLTFDEYREKFPFENGGFAPLSIPGTSIGNIDFDFQKKETTVDKKNKVEVLKVLKNENGLTEKEIAKRAGLTPDAVWTVALQMDDPNAEYSIDVNDKKQYFLCQNGAIYVTPVSNKHRGDVEIVGVPEKSEYQFASVNRIKPSPTNPRRRFDETSLDELAANIEENGLINPITVRRALIAETDQFDFEIVAGERRWRATQRTSHKTIPVIVKELSDEQVLEIQIHENLHREEVHPLDEAFAYEHLMKTLNITQEELALRVGKPEKFVRTRLKLNQLIPEAQEDLEANRITIKMALEIAKFDREVQPKVLACAFDEMWENGGYVPDRDTAKSFGEFLETIKEEVLLNLSSAKFSLTDTRLRADGLACISCPERTGAKNSLFEDFDVDEDDQCLNEKCFESKTEKNAVVFYKDKNEKFIAENGLADDFRLLPLAWYPSKKVFLETLFQVPVYSDHDYRNASNTPCDYRREGIFLDDSSKFGQIVQVCTVQACKVHWSGSSSAASSSSDSGAKAADAELKARKERLERKQYLLDVRVGEPTRVEVLKIAAKEFGESHPGNLSTSYPIGEYFAESLAQWFYLQSKENEMTAKVFIGIMSEWCGNCPTGLGWQFEEEKWINFFNNQREEILAAIYFLLVHGHKGEMFYETKHDQSEIVAIAEKYNVSYELVYAQNLVKKCAEDKQYKKFLDAAKVYLQAIERGEKIDRPVFFKVE